MESFCEFIKNHKQSRIDNGLDIDYIFSQEDSNGNSYFGTILHYSIIHDYERIVQYALSRGANIAIKIIPQNEQLGFTNVIELSANIRNNSIFELLKEQSLQLYSSYGLTSFHLECALYMELYNQDTLQKLQSADVNATVSSASPFWPNMTPLLIAAKFDNEDLVAYLINRGANPLLQEGVDINYLAYRLSYSTVEDKQIFLRCIRRLIMLDVNHQDQLTSHIAPKKFKDIYFAISREFNWWDKFLYSCDCLDELRSHAYLGLGKMIDDSIIVKANFKDKFRWLESFDFDHDYPIYSKLLKVRTKQTLLEYEKKRDKIFHAVLLVQWLFQSLCNLPFFFVQNRFFGI